MPKALLRILSLLLLAFAASSSAWTQGVSADLVVTTVLDAHSIQVTWLLPDGPAVTRQELQRLKAGSAYEPIADLPVGVTSFIDTDVSTEDSSYAYRLLTEDVNGEVRYSNEGQSMMLIAQRIQGAIQLDWNAYVFWARDVEGYELEVRQENVSDWVSVATLPPGTLSHTDATPYPEGAIYCWRVRASEREGNRATSLSNEACQPVGLIIPNTFSPNGDGINDDWHIDGLELFPGSSCTIYNRWGQQVFESSRTDFRWDGKGGNDLPDGAYYYTLKVGGREEPFRGYIMLLR